MESIWFIANLVDVLVDGPDHDLVRVYAAPGDMPPLHVHEHDDEGFYVLEGELTVWAGDAEPVVLGPGEFFNAPHGVPHTYRATSTEPAVSLVTSAPSGFAAFVREAGVPAERHELPVLDGPPDAERLARIAAAHGITLLGPPGMLPREAAAAAA
jgi:mannose-6-phosphate isomerase-like protein (cupin superfamily)